MVYFSHSHVCVKCRKRARNFLGGGCALIKAFWTVSQWVNASQIAFNTNISPTFSMQNSQISKRYLIYRNTDFETEYVHGDKNGEAKI